MNKKHHPTQKTTSTKTLIGNARSVRLTHLIAHHFGGYYFRRAERTMQKQWDELIHPSLKAILGLNLESVLELAPGYGRNSAHLLPLIGRQLHLVDANAICIERCRERFSTYPGPVEISYYVNDGASLNALADASVTFIYTFDSMVHFDLHLTQAYLKEFARVLTRGGHGFIHHSNAGARSKRFWLFNPGRRSAVTIAQFAECCMEAGLEVASQKPLAWGGVPNLDGITVVQRLN